MQKSSAEIAVSEFPRENFIPIYKLFYHKEIFCQDERIIREKYRRRKKRFIQVITDDVAKRTVCVKMVAFFCVIVYTLCERREGEVMDIEIKMDENCKETKVIIVTDKMTDEIHALINRLHRDTPEILMGMQNDSLEILQQQDIFQIYGEQGKVIAVTEKGKYLLKLRLYELEERLDQKSFVRISHSEIINLKKVKKFDLSYSGTIAVSLINGSVTYVSRRYVAKIKKVLGI